MIGELAQQWAPRAAWEALIGRPCSWAWGFRGATGLRVLSTIGSKHSWVCFQKSSSLPKRENSVPREVLEGEHFSLPSNELGHCWSWRMFFSITVMKLEGCSCSRCDTCCWRRGGPGTGAQRADETQTSCHWCLGRPSSALQRPWGTSGLVAGLSEKQNLAAW